MESKPLSPKITSILKVYAVQFLFLLILSAIIFFSYILWHYNLTLSIIWIIIFSGILIYSVFIEPNLLEFNYFNLEFPNLDSELNKFCIAQISDIHYKNSLGLKRLRKIVESVNEINPDLICLTGDFLDVHSYKKLEECVNVLSNLKAKFGVWAILGNHDFYFDVESLIRELEKHNITVLINESVKILDSEKPLWLVGVNDPYHKLADLKKAIAGLSDSDFKVLLAHSPEIIDEAVDFNINLVLSGHTHGGQIHLPGNKMFCSLPSKYKKYMQGLFKINPVRKSVPLEESSQSSLSNGVENTYLYVNRGLGKVMLPMRFLCKPEVAVFRLNAKK